MPPDRDRIRLLHMLEHAREAMQLVAGRNRSDLDTDRVLNLALVRLLEIVGEAAARVSSEARAGTRHSLSILHVDNGDTGRTRARVS